jgi:nucleoid-associated protein YgaU
MTTRQLLLRAGVTLALFAGLPFDPSSSLVPNLVPAAQAIVGAPMTPGSVAGVARRTARRTTAVVASSSAASANAASANAAASQQQAAAAQQQAAMAQQQAAAAQQQAAQAEAEAAAARQEAAAAAQSAPRGAALPVGTTISALPAGCTSLNIGGVDYFNCGGTYLRPAFQSGNVVYVVSQP